MHGEAEPLDKICMKLYGIETNIRVLGETMEEAYVVKKLLRAVLADCKHHRKVWEFGDNDSRGNRGSFEGS